MRWGKSMKNINIICSIIIISLLCIIFLQYRNISEYKIMPAYIETDQIFVDKAVDLYLEENGGKRREIFEDMYPIVVHLEDEVCVELAIKIGALGGSPSYCFRADNGNLTKKHTNVE
jgi:hypothetical protein